MVDGKIIHVAILESEDEAVLKLALQNVLGERVNILSYKVEDSRLRIIFAALREAVVSSQ